MQDFLFSSTRCDEIGGAAMSKVIGLGVMAKITGEDIVWVWVRDMVRVWLGL